MAGPRVVNRLPQFVAERQARAARAMNAALVLGAAEASVLTPIDTSNLLNSQYKRVDVDGERIVGTVGYTADYAKHVHDPAVKQTFRRATAEKEFLEKGMRRAEPQIRQVLVGALRT